MNLLKPDQVRVILVETMGEANIGAVARSLACFGVTDWWLVRPQRRPSQQSQNWATHAAAWLDRIQYAETLPEALVGIDLSVALTGKSGKRRHRLVTPAGLSDTVIPRFQLGRLALVFGNEESGLDNADIAICHWRVKIPTDPVHSSLNLAHAVTLMLYELLGRYRDTDLGSKPNRWAEPKLLQGALGEISRYLSDHGYPSHDATLDEELRKINDILHRSRLEVFEVNFLLGIIRHLRNYERINQQGE
ncbi:MAG: RNA methyltransferase [Candidatus Eremiobacteraeota bacterium]|nr:RNA methyltransferase [Candidatus Eremiobacteraeota bacterium]MCW5870244.1 RNA methyltransferase [Candidatus Eremiobacteraeota bacterium]